MSLENTGSWLMNQVFENEWGGRKESTEKVMLELHLQNKWDLQIREDRAVYFLSMAGCGDKPKFLPMVQGKWLVSKILHFAPISRMTLASEGLVLVESPICENLWSSNDNATL